MTEEEKDFERWLEEQARKEAERAASEEAMWREYEARLQAYLDEIQGIRIDALNKAEVEDDGETV